MKCPKCGSKEVEIKKVMKSNLLMCLKCGFDESEMLEVYAESRSTQSGKTKFTPYKKGGGKRSTNK